MLLSTFLRNYWTPYRGIDTDTKSKQFSVKGTYWTPYRGIDTEPLFALTEEKFYLLLNPL